VAEHQDSYEFAAVEAKDIIAERQRGWENFTQFITWSIVLTAIILLAMLLFLA